MFALALLLASAQQRTISAMQAGAPAIKRWGGAIPLLVGAWFLTLAAFAHPFAHIFPV